MRGHSSVSISVYCAVHVLFGTSCAGGDETRHVALLPLPDRLPAEAPPPQQLMRCAPDHLTRRDSTLHGLLPVLPDRSDAIGLGIDFQSHLSRPAPSPTPAPRALGLEATLTFYSYCILPLSLTGASLILVTFQLDSLLWLRVQVIIISTRLCVYELTFNNWGFFPTYLSNFTHYSLLFS